MSREKKLERLGEITEMIEKLKKWREGFQEHLQCIDFEIEDMKQERHYLLEDLWKSK